MAYRFCPTCGGDIVYLVPVGEQRERAVCQQCALVHYHNPHLVVGAVAIYQDQFLLCQRAIEPRRGYWTLPAGYMELQETSEQGACREAMEEANAQLAIQRLLAVYNLAHISQVQILYLAELVSPKVWPGEESLAVGLFAYDEIPWQELAFPSVQWALKHARQLLQHPELGPDQRSTGLELSQLEY